MCSECEVGVVCVVCVRACVRACMCVLTKNLSSIPVLPC